jgi:hypothetical protein
MDPCLQSAAPGVLRLAQEAVELIDPRIASAWTPEAHPCSRLVRPFLPTPDFPVLDLQHATSQLQGVNARKACASLKPIRNR